MVLPKQETLENDLQKAFLYCKDYIQTVFDVSLEHVEILDWFQGLCKLLTNVIGLIRSYYNETSGKYRSQNQSTVFLFLTQLLTSLSLLINTLVCEEAIRIILIEVRKCVMKQMCCCLDLIKFTIDCKNSPEDSGNFVTWMDTALEKVSEISLEDGSNVVDAYEETRLVFEEVLSHAMSIAQVSLSDDSKIIRGSCQTVLSTLNSLEKEVHNTVANRAMVNLFIDACTDKLCHLEKKVNTAILKLCLKTFSQFTLPLEKIHSFCFDSSNKEQIEDLDSLVVDFDLHVDQIMQIGLFAVSCSSNFISGIKIKSCLASLEALESELVPALTAVLLDKSVHNINAATILMKHWIHQARCLQQLIYLIIDPFAFCQIIYKEAANIVDKLSNSLKKKCLIGRNDLQSFIVTTRVLQGFLEKAQTEFSDYEIDKLKAKLKVYKEVLKEVEKASTVLLRHDNNNMENCKRVLKRCKILVTLLKQLWMCFAEDVLPGKSCSERQIKPNLEVSKDSTQNPFLDHIITKGKQILQDRSVLYRTPNKNNSTRKNGQNQSVKNQKKETPLSRLVHLRKLSFMKVDKSETSIDLQITEILNDITNLSRTFNT